MAVNLSLWEVWWERAVHGSLGFLSMNCLHLLERWGCRFESHLRHGCLYVFILCSCCLVCR
jgi:hypothetical protein